MSPHMPKRFCWAEQLGSHLPTLLGFAGGVACFDGIYPSPISREGRLEIELDRQQRQ